MPIAEAPDAVAIIVRLPVVFSSIDFIMFMEVVLQPSLPDEQILSLLFFPMYLSSVLREILSLKHVFVHVLVCISLLEFVVSSVMQRSMNRRNRIE